MILTDFDLLHAIERALKSSRALCAVAFWGTGSDRLFAASELRDRRVICNLSMGGTNPIAIKRLLELEVHVRQNDLLHAKLYIGENDAVLTSANASPNGLGFGGDVGWVEAGWVIPADAALAWFEALWQQSREIQIPSDLNSALVAFLRKKKQEDDSASIEFEPSTVSREQEREDLSSIYSTLSIIDAIRVVLSVYQQPLTLPQLVVELEAGGLTTAAKLPDAVSNALQRGALRGIIGKAGRARWGLIGWEGVTPVQYAPRDQRRSERNTTIDERLSERTRAGLAAARLRGVAGGAPGKLTDKDRAAILSAIASGDGNSVIARRFNVTAGAIRKIRLKQKAGGN